MPLTADAYKAQIVDEVGDTASGHIAANVSTYWTMYDHVTSLHLRYLYAKRKAIDVLLGKVREQVDMTGVEGVRAALDQKSKHLLAMRETVEADIKATTMQGAGQPTIGTLTQTAPVMPPVTGGIDANDRRYRGDPYRR